MSTAAQKKDWEEQISNEEDGADNPDTIATCGVVRPVMERIDEVDGKSSSSRDTLSSMRAAGTSSGEFGSKCTCDARVVKLQTHGPL